MIGSDLAETPRPCLGGVDGARSPYAVAEHAVALLMALNRKVSRASARTNDANFSLDGLVGFDVHGKTVAVVGCGRVRGSVVSVCACMCVFMYVCSLAYLHTFVEHVFVVNGWTRTFDGMMSGRNVVININNLNARALAGDFIARPLVHDVRRAMNVLSWMDAS